MLKSAGFKTAEPQASGGAAPTPRAFLRIGPASLARHQLSLALAMDCQRIVCIAADMAPELVQMQHDSERAGAKFHVVSGAHGLAALVTAADDLLVIGDGLLAPLDTAASLLEGAHAVLVQPVESGLAAGFERIDLNHASAGLMRIPGRLAEQLHELAADCDPDSALTRIALQAGVAQRPLPAEMRDGLRWRLVRGEGEAHSAEAGWIALHLDDDGSPTPGSALARFAVRNFGPAILHAGSGGNALAIGSAAGMAIALGFAWFGFTATALIIWALCWALRRTGSLLLAVERESLVLGPGKWSREPIFGWVHDAALLAVLAWNAPPFAESSLWSSLFAPLMLISMLRLAPRLLGDGWGAWLGDRLLLGLLLAAIASAGVLAPALQIAAAALAILAIVWPFKAIRLTSV